MCAFVLRTLCVYFLLDLCPPEMEPTRVTPASHDDMIREYPISGRAAGWYFRVSEKRPSVWDVEGKDIYGREVSRLGVLDADRALEECIQYARTVSRD